MSILGRLAPSRILGDSSTALQTGLALEDDTSNALSVAAARLFLFWFIGIVAANTPLTFAARLAGLSFGTFSGLCITLIGLVTLVTVYFGIKEVRSASQRDYPELVALLCIGLLGATIALVSHRADIDDCSYFAEAVYSLDNPNSPMGFIFHYAHGINWGHEPLDNFPYPPATTTYDLLRASIAHVTGIPFMSVYFLLFVGLAGFSVPVAAFYALSHFSTKTRIAVLGALISIGVTILLGESHRSYGNFSYNRIFQHKVIMVNTGVYLCAAAVLSFFKKPTYFSWILLFSMATAAVGLSPSGIVVIGSLTVVVVIGAFLASPNKLPAFRVSALCGASLAYVAFYAIYLKLSLGPRMGVGDPQHIGYPDTFLGHLGLITNPEKPVTWFVLAGSIILSAALTRGRMRIVLLGWQGAAIVLFLNPVLSPILIKQFTSPNIYWRLFFILPAPLFTALGAVALYEYTQRLGRVAHRSLWTIVVVALVCLHFTPGSPSVFRNGTTIDWPRAKIYTADHQIAREVINTNPPPGPMLAPKHIGLAIPMMTSAYPQVRGFEHLLWSFGWLHDRAEEVNLRVAASDFVMGDGTKFEAFKEYLEKDRMTSVVIANQIAQDKQVQAVLAQNGITGYKPINGFVVFWRPTPSG